MSEEQMSDDLLKTQPWCPVGGGWRNAAYFSLLFLSIWACGTEANISGREY